VWGNARQTHSGSSKDLKEEPSEILEKSELVELCLKKIEGERLEGTEREKIREKSSLVRS